MRRGQERLARRHVVLLGIGHTNAHIVRMWGMNPIAGTDLTCISDKAVATYSGMLPAVLAGQNSRSEMEIDLVRLCASVGARLVFEGVNGLDVARRLVLFGDRPPIPFDVLSVGVGSVPTVDGTEVESESLLKIKPMQTFLDRLSNAVKIIVDRIGARPLKVLIAGSGVAGTEITFCLSAFLNRKAAAFSLHMVTRSEEILAGVMPSLRKRVLTELLQRDVAVSTGKIVTKVTPEGVWLNNGELIEADLVVWATGANAPPVLAQLQLPVDERGFLTTDATLRSTSGAAVFAVGDSGTIVSRKLPKAGVYAVRQGPILWDNIQKCLDGKTLVEYRPQKSFLKLLNAGDGSAIGEYKGFSFSGRWVMKWKKRIDQKFMRMYQNLYEETAAGEQMQCKGCGCKVGGDILESVLQNAESASGSLLKGDALDDAVEISMSLGNSVLASTDFFSSPFDDHYLAGRIAALHAASDLVAMGATVSTALANVVLPEGDAKSQRFAFNDLMEGARHEFAAFGATIAGGHTIVGPRLEIGFTVIGEAISHDGIMRKSNLRVGDVLYLTKPLGIGVLLAAHMQNACSATDYQELVAAMLERQHEVVAVAVRLGISAATDVTGFGLIGHLIEMLKASNTSAELSLSQIPLLSGVAAAFANGIESTLAPQNRCVESLIKIEGRYQSDPVYRSLFDPQTCGGLLLGVAPETAEQFQQETAPFFSIHKIGTVTMATSIAGEVTITGW